MKKKRAWLVSFVELLRYQYHFKEREREKKDDLIQSTLYLDVKIRTWTRHFTVLCASWHFYTLERNLLVVCYCLFHPACSWFIFGTQYLGSVLEPLCNACSLNQFFFEWIRKVNILIPYLSLCEFYCGIMGRFNLF